MTEKPTENATAIHLQSGDDHLFALNNIQVFIDESDDGWFAQGIQVDYFACGESLEDVKDRFTRGLIASIEEHLRRFNTFENFLKWAPEEVRQEIQNKVDSERYNYTVLNTCHIEKPSLNIQYIKVEPKTRTA